MKIFFQKANKILFSSVFSVFFISALITHNASAASKEEIEIKVNGALERFKTEIMGGEEFLKKANGVLVMPDIVKAGFVFGGEYGEGALQIKGKTVDYYNVGGISFGFQIGAQSKTLVMVFLSEEALNKFRSSEGWKAGVDGSVALIKWGVGEDINTAEVDKPIVGFVFGNKGLMYNLTIEGSKFSKIVK